MYAHFHDEAMYIFYFVVAPLSWTYIIAFKAIIGTIRIL